MRVLRAKYHKLELEMSKKQHNLCKRTEDFERQNEAEQVTTSRLHMIAIENSGTRTRARAEGARHPHESTALSRGERVSGSGAFISRSVTGEGSVHRALPPCCDRMTDQASPNRSATRGGLEGHGESRATLRRVSSTKPVGNVNSPSPGPRWLMKAPSRSTLSPGRGLTYPGFVGQRIQFALAQSCRLGARGV
jgi:hypothetical protein